MSDVVRQVLLADERRRHALIAGDVEALGALLSPDLRFVHTTAAVDDRGALLHKVATGALRYQAIDLLEASVDVYDRVAIVCSKLRMFVLASGALKTIHCRVLATWISVDGAWVLRHYQTTRVAP